MYYLRTGQLEKARADIEEALQLAPWQAASLLLRGLIKFKQNDETAEQDIANAIARQPDLVDIYSRWGFAIN
jgi:Tfp pilus assembly protein PilF